MRAAALPLLLVFGTTLSKSCSAFSPPTARRLVSSPASSVAKNDIGRGGRRRRSYGGGGGGVGSAFGVDVVGADGGVVGTTSTALEMYNLPPSGGGGGGGRGPFDELKAILPGVLTIVGFLAFLASPLGSVFFFVTNSLLALAFLTPVVLLVGFQLWQFFNTTEGPCPSCGTPVRTLKDDGGNPTICLNCGSLVRASADGDGLELCNDPESMFAQDGGMFGGGGLFEDLFGGGGVTGPGDTVVTTTTTTTVTEEERRKDETRRQRTVIDVDVEVD
eukprot:CAMPEP_0197435996 /NCGR_PEP_ID=MMETSP1175-20131217/3475_1 /TAXON_ID=1003142 /ORGANISM="Triceratium dubium, Strain CCMP147" /LENGTH=274 /DNA_ID=CAMNT_0042965163 /DNA_START=142 /DNA_END=966 /DNA_ORIENTATION=+